jgi:hypothetical protein
MTQYTAQTEPSGRFSIKRILPGAYILEVVAEGGYAEKRDIEVPPSGSVNVRFEIPLTRIEGRVVTTAGLRPPVEGTLRVISKEPDGPVLYVYPNAEGRFSVSIKAGSYRISTEFLGAPVRSIRDESKDLEGGVFTFDGKQKPNLIIVVEP